MSEPDFVPLRIAVRTISDTRTEESDRSGAFLVERIGAAGHDLASYAILADEEVGIREALATLVADRRVDVILTTGGTGLTSRDVTPEAIAPLVTKSIPGFGELFRMLSHEEIGTSTLQSRVLGALCSDTFVFALPGSPSACATGWNRILVHQLDVRHRPCNFVELLPRIRGRSS